MNENEKDLVEIECNCGCGVMKITKYDYEPIDYNISYYKSMFYSNQISIIKLILTRIKHAWFTLIGKEYWLFDICLSSNQFEKFKQELNNI